MRDINRKKGQGLVEYALIVGLMAVVLIAILSGIGRDSVAIMYKTIAYSVENVEKDVTNAASNSTTP